jgi:hypothetical protein
MFASRERLSVIMLQSIAAYPAAAVACCSTQRDVRGGDGQ